MDYSGGLNVITRVYIRGKQEFKVREGDVAMETEVGVRGP